MTSQEYLESKSYVSGIGTVRKVTLNDALIAIEMAHCEGLIAGLSEALDYDSADYYREQLSELRKKHNIL